MAALGGCAAPTARSGRASGGLEAYCEIARLPDLDAWAGEVVTRCSVVDPESEAVRCSAGRVRFDGALEALSLPQAPPFQRVLPAAGGQFVLLLSDARLVLTDGQGAVRRELAAWASDPWTSEDGSRVAWVGLQTPAPEPEFDAPTQILAQGIEEAAPTVIAVDALAGAPRPVPGSTEVLFTSARAGAAGVWLGGPGQSPRQLTNVGLFDVEPGFVPVPDRELAWVDGALFYASAEFDRTHVWRLDPRAAVATEVGPGRWPRREPSGDVVAALEGDDPCATRYGAGGTP